MLHGNSIPFRILWHARCINISGLRKTYWDCQMRLALGLIFLRPRPRNLFISQFWIWFGYSCCHKQLSGGLWPYYYGFLLWIGKKWMPHDVYKIKLDHLLVKKELVALFPMVVLPPFQVFERCLSEMDFDSKRKAYALISILFPLRSGFKSTTFTFYCPKRKTAKKRFAFWLSLFERLRR